MRWFPVCLGHKEWTAQRYFRQLSCLGGPVVVYLLLGQMRITFITREWMNGEVVGIKKVTKEKEETEDVPNKGIPPSHEQHINNERRDSHVRDFCRMYPCRRFTLRLLNPRR